MPSDAPTCLAQNGKVLLTNWWVSHWDENEGEGSLMDIKVSQAWPTWCFGGRNILTCYPQLISVKSGDFKHLNLKGRKECQGREMLPYNKRYNSVLWLNTPSFYSSAHVQAISTLPLFTLRFQTCDAIALLQNPMMTWRSRFPLTCFGFTQGKCQANHNLSTKHHVRAVARSLVTNHVDFAGAERWVCFLAGYVTLFKTGQQNLHALIANLGHISSKDRAKWHL